MHDRTKNLTNRQTITAKWHAKSGNWAGKVERVSGPALCLPTAPDFPSRPGPNDPMHVQVPLIKEWNAESERWTITLGCAGGRQLVYAVDQWPAGRAWPVDTSWWGLLRLAFMTSMTIMICVMSAVTIMVLATVATPSAYRWAFAPAFSYAVLALLIAIVALLLRPSATFAICDAKPSDEASVKSPSRTRAVINAV